MTPTEEQRYEQRFDRIEVKLDRLVEIVSSLARVEEQMAHNAKRLDLMEHRIERAEADIDAVAELSRANSFVAKFADKVFWLLVAGIISVGVFLLQAAISGV